MFGPGSYLIGQQELDEVLDVFKSGQLSRYRSAESNGTDIPKVYQLERQFESLTGAKHCIAVNSGTSALMVSLAGLGVGPGDEVIVPGFSFVAPVSAIIYSGAVPVFVEIDESLTLDPIDLELKITPRTKAIMAVHMLGAPCNMDEIMRIAKEHNVQVVEDACQACGGSYKGARLGTIGAFGAFSLNVYKTITAGEGGIVVTNSTPSLSLSHRPVGELTNTGVGAMGLKRGRPVQFHRPLVEPQKGRLPLLVPWGLGPAPRGLATAP